MTAEKNSDPRRKERHGGKGASSARVYASIVAQPARTRAARRATAARPSRITSSVQCGKPRRIREIGTSEREAVLEKRERGRGNDSKRGEVAFNQSPASKCTVHVYTVYTAGGKGEEGSGERYMVRLVFAREVAWKLAPN